MNPDPQGPSPERILVEANNLVTVKLASALTGLSEGSIRKRIERGIWLEGLQYYRDKLGTIWIDRRAVDRWVVSGT